MNRSLVALLVLVLGLGLGVNRTSPGTGLHGSNVEDDPYTLDTRGGPSTGLLPGAPDPTLTSSFFGHWAEDSWDSLGGATDLVVGEVTSPNGSSYVSTATSVVFQVFPIDGTVHDWTFRAGNTWTGTGTIGWYLGDDYTTATLEMDCGWTNPTQGDDCTTAGATTMAVTSGQATYMEVEENTLTGNTLYGFQSWRWSFTGDEAYKCMQPLMGQGRADANGVNRYSPMWGNRSSSESSITDVAMIAPADGTFSRLHLATRQGRIGGGNTLQATVIHRIGGRDVAYTDTNLECPIAGAGTEECSNTDVADSIDVAAGDYVLLRTSGTLTSNTQYGVGIAWEPDDCESWIGGFSTDDNLSAGHHPWNGLDERELVAGSWCSGPTSPAEGGVNGPGGASFTIHDMYVGMEDSPVSPDSFIFTWELRDGDIVEVLECTVIDDNQCEHIAGDITWDSGDCAYISHVSVDSPPTQNGTYVYARMTGGPGPP